MLSELFMTNVAWQDEKTMLQEETIAFILDTMAQITTAPNPTMQVRPSELESFVSMSHEN